MSDVTTMSSDLRTSQHMYDIGEMVVLDGRADLPGRVTGILFEARDTPPEYRIAWANSGSIVEMYAHEWRLQRVAKT